MSITNPEAMREAAPDLSCGIPQHLWAGSDVRTREWLLAEYARQLAAVAHQREATDAKRQESLRRILARPHAATEPAAQLRRLQQLLFEAAAVAGTLANLPAADGPSADATASPTQEHPQ